MSFIVIMTRNFVWGKDIWRNGDRRKKMVAAHPRDARLRLHFLHTCVIEIVLYNQQTPVSMTRFL